MKAENETPRRVWPPEANAVPILQRDYQAPIRVGEREVGAPMATRNSEPSHWPLIAACICAAGASVLLLLALTA